MYIDRLKQLKLLQWVYVCVCMVVFALPHGVSSIRCRNYYRYKFMQMFTVLHCFCCIMLLVRSVVRRFIKLYGKGSLHFKEKGTSRAVSSIKQAHNVQIVFA